MNELSQDELTVLLIAREGEMVIPIGRWKEPIEKLLERGYLRKYKHPGDPTGHFNNTITPAGKKAADEAENDSLRAVINASNEVANSKATTKAMAEQIARQLVDLSRISSKITGDYSAKALENWSRVILQRALELLQ